MDTDGTTVRMTVAQAARTLGISAEAVRQRVRRGTLPTEKSEDGGVFVLVDTERTRTDVDGTDDGTTDKALLAAHLDHALNEIKFLREELTTRNEELRRKDTIIMTMAQRIPELEPAQEPRESSETATPKPEGVEVPLKEEQRPWWRKLFG